jgi:hypothetical protein
LADNLYFQINFIIILGWFACYFQNFIFGGGKRILAKVNIDSILSDTGTDFYYNFRLVLVLFPKVYLGGGKRILAKVNIDSILSDTGTAFYVA